MRHRPWFFILIPLLLHSAEALAWGLATHLYFSQLLLWAVPLLDPRLRAAAKRSGPGLAERLAEAIR